MKRIVIVAILSVVLVLIFRMFASDPMISCKIDVPENYIEAIESQSKGLYSKKLPLVPIYASVDTFAEGKVYYTIHYFPFGTVGMSYVEGDGYNIEKALTRF